MNRTDPESVLRSLASTGASESSSSVDVSHRVMHSIANINAQAIGMDTSPLVLGGAIVATAACLMLVMYSDLATIAQPWVSFWLL